MTMQITAENIDSISLSEALGIDISQGVNQDISQNRLSNFISSVHAYADMSPDLSIRKDVNYWMIRRDRQALEVSDWCQLFVDQLTNNSGNSEDSSSNSNNRGHRAHAVLAFIYESFGDYSGLDFGRVRPNDSLNTHLKFPLVCWFDWTITFCEDFFQIFGVDLSDRFDEADFSTLGEVAGFLVGQVEAAA